MNKISTNQGKTFGLRKTKFINIFLEVNMKKIYFRIMCFIMMLCLFLNSNFPLFAFDDTGNSYNIELPNDVIDDDYNNWTKIQFSFHIAL